jgi:hypothetical protein
MDPRGVQKDQLGTGAVQHAQDTVAGGLGLFAGNGDLLSEHLVEQVDLPTLGAPTMATRPHLKSLLFSEAAVRRHGLG